MDFSFIIINYRSLDYTRVCLKSLFEFLPDDQTWEVILIDNNSSDGSAEKLATEFPTKLTLIKNDSNRGFAAANNQGAEIARGQFLFFLNSDTEIKSNLLKPIRQLFDRQPELGIIAPLVLGPDGKLQFGACGRRQTLKNVIFQKTKTNWRQESRADYYLSDWVSGAALVIRHDLFNKLDGWDENFFLYLEDSDLCFRVQKAGFEIGLCPAANLVHYGGKSPATNHARRRHYYRSQSYFFKKHYGPAAAFILKLIRWPYKTLVLLKK